MYLELHTCQWSYLYTLWLELSVLNWSWKRLLYHYSINPMRIVLTLQNVDVSNAGASSCFLNHKPNTMTSHNSHYHHCYHLFFVLAIFVSFSTTTFPTSVSARLFPNVSSIPTWIASHAPPGAWDAYRNFTGCRQGEKYDGLSKLKTYFNEFGYIPNSPSNFTDDFDDAFEAAVRNYQKNFNLNVTGILDETTLGQIIKPRCGVADIINGTTTMNSGKTNSSASSNGTLKFHTVSHYTFFPEMQRWPEGTEELTYAFDPDNGLDDVVKGVFKNAFDRWSNVTTITFRETTSYASANIKIGFYSGDHGDGEPFDGVLGTLAHAFSPTNGRFHLDMAEDWVATGDVTASDLSNAVDLESVAVHEIGHLLGLGHSSVEEAIMYPTITARTRKVELANDDIQGIQVLYGSNPNYTPSTTTTSSRERDSSYGFRHVGSTWGMLLFLLFVVGRVLMSTDKYFSGLFHWFVGRLIAASPSSLHSKHNRNLHRTQASTTATSIASTTAQDNKVNSYRFFYAHYVVLPSIFYVHYVLRCLSSLKIENRGSA
ncbi:hypothetical protein RIF29_36204 [Crotalaria pallida]|uniref:Peptidase metallopeptidase domain-containing protein n=1 Tax=Crotalaria pallida TaxID=3830 RepID=A0AAN9HYE9_CROPI